MEIKQHTQYICLYRQSLYDNEQQIQDHFGMFWERVAERFEGNEYVLAYELLNEPWAGDVYRHPDQLEPRELVTQLLHDGVFLVYIAYTYIYSHADVADAKNLQPMYKKLHESIRKYDQKHIIMFEPTIIITSVNIHPNKHCKRIVTTLCACRFLWEALPIPA